MKGLILTMVTQTIIRMAMEVSRKSDVRYKHGAVLLNGNRPLSVGFNTSAMWSPEICTTHAEMAVIRNRIGRHRKYHSLKRDKLSKCNLLVVRVSPEGHLMQSKPCLDCIKTLNEVSVKWVYYSDHLGQIVRERVSHMTGQRTHMNVSIGRS